MPKIPPCKPENRLKAMLLQHLLQSKNTSADIAIINEFTLDFYSSRADIALVKENGIEIFEIKSEADKLTRLPHQIDALHKFCDKLHVVVAPCHLEKPLERAREDTAIWEIDSFGVVKKIRRGKKVMLRDKQKLVRLVNLEELQKILRWNGFRASGYNRERAEEAAQAIGVQKLRDGIMLLLRERYTQTTKKFLNTVRYRREVKPDSLASLRRWRTTEKMGKLPMSDDPFLQKIAIESTGSLFGKIPEDIEFLGAKI